MARLQKMRVVFSPQAQRDIEEVWDFTAATWGAEQAEKYIRDIQIVAGQLIDNPHLGRRCEEIRPGYRRMPIGSHIMFYRLQDNDIVIIRILHQKMDHPSRL